MIDGKVTASLSVADAAITVDSGPGAQTATFQFTGTWSGTITFEANVDEGSAPTWVTVKAAKSGTTTYATTTTSSGIFHVAFGAARSIRARFSTATSGTVVATARISPALLITESAGGGGGGGAVTVDNAGDVVDGAVVALGTTTNAGVTTDTTGTVIGFLRGNIIKWVSALTQIGIVTEAAPANDTASSGLNGRLQRIAQRITSLIALVPAALTGTGNFKVSIEESTATVIANTEITAAATDGDTFDIAATGLGKVGVIMHAMSAGGTLAGRVISHTSASDGRANTLNGLLVQNVPYIRNAANTNDPQRGANAGTGTTGTGVPCAAPMIWDGSTNYVRLKGNTDGTLPVGGFAPAAPTCTFTRGANATPYTIGDEVGTAGTAPTTIAVGRVNGGTGLILGATAVYSNAPTITPNMVLMLFSATTTLAGDNAQLNLSDAHAALCIGFIPLSASQDGSYSAGARSTSGNLIFLGAPAAPIHFVCGGSETTIYACLVTLNAFTPIANSETITVTLSVEQN